jgi:hypothetical protein
MLEKWKQELADLQIIKKQKLEEIRPLAKQIHILQTKICIYE